MLYKINENLWVNFSDVLSVMFEPKDTFRIYFRYDKGFHISETNDPQSCATIKTLLQQHYEQIMVPKK